MPAKPRYRGHGTRRRPRSYGIGVRRFSGAGRDLGPGTGAQVLDFLRLTPATKP